MPVPIGIEPCPSEGGTPLSNFFTVGYVDDHGLRRAHQSDEENSPLVASASLAFDHVRLSGPGEPGATSILAPKKSRAGTPKLN